MEVIPPHPLEDVKPIKADNTGRVRYLTPAEEQRLRKALTRAMRHGGTT